MVRALLSIVIPTYNERDNILPLVSEIEKSLASYNFEIVIVDDNSPDETWRYAANLCIFKNIVVVRRMNLRGLATAIIDGMAFSRGEYVAVMDADLQHPPAYLRNMIDVARMQGLDLVIGSRYMKGGGVEGWSRTRLLISRGATLLAKLLLPEARKISDPMSGFFLVRRDIVMAHRSKLNPRGYKVLLEILVRCTPARVGEIPYVFKQRLHGKSKLGLKTIVDYVIHVLKLSGWRPFKFASVGALGTIVNLVTLYILGLIAPQLLKSFFAIGSAIAIETSTLFNFTLHEHWTFRDRRGGPILRRVLFFHLAILPAILVQYFTAIGLRYLLAINPFVAQFMGIALGFVVNYVISELGVWTRKSAE